MVTKKAGSTKKTVGEPEAQVAPAKTPRTRKATTKTAEKAEVAEPKAKATRKPRVKKGAAPAPEAIVEPVEAQPALDLSAQSLFIGDAPQNDVLPEVELMTDPAPAAPEALIVETGFGAVGFFIPPGMGDVVLFGTEPTDDPPAQEPAPEKPRVIHNTVTAATPAPEPAQKKNGAPCAVHAPVHCHTAADLDFQDTARYLFVAPTGDSEVSLAMMQVAVELQVLEDNRFDTAAYELFYALLSTNPKERRQAEKELERMLCEVSGKDAIVLIAAQISERTVEETRRALQYAQRLAAELPLKNDQNQPVTLLSVLLKQDGFAGSYRPELCV